MQRIRWAGVPDVALADENTGVVDGLGKTELVDASLETALQEVLNLQGQDVIEPHAGLVEDTDADETADEGVSLKEALGVLLVESQERTAHISLLRAHSQMRKQYLPGSTTDLGEGQLDAPDLTLVAQSIFAHELELVVANPSLTSRVADISGARSRSVAIDV